jgi:Fe-S cluster assembly iron-binding protein IscA
MVSVTERAGERLRDIQSAAGIERADVALRMVPCGPGEMGLLPDVRRAGDEVVTHEGTPVLLVDRDVAASIADATIDCRTTRQGPKLVLRRPRRGLASVPPVAW